MSKILNLAKKVKALADQGVGGEKENAAAILLALCNQHGIRPEDLEDEAVTTRVFSTTPDTEKIILQCIASTTVAEISGWVDKRKPRDRFVKVTDAEYLEIQAKIEFYVPIWLKELRTFRSAFIQVNDLGAKGTGNEPPAEPMEPEELAELLRKMKAMDKNTLAKRLKA